MNETTETAAPEVTEAPKAAPSEDAELGAVWDKLQDQPRSEDGKFASREPVTEAVEDAETTEATERFTEEAQEQSEETQAEEKPATAAPAHLPQAIKAEWEKIPEAARESLASFTQEWDRKFGELGKQLDTVRPIADQLMQATQTFPEFRGMTPQQLAEGALQLAAVQTRLGNDPVNTILDVANTYGVLPQLTEKLTGQQATPEQNELAGLRQEILGLKQAVSPQVTTEAIQEQVSQAVQLRDAEAAIEAFARTKPYYADVEAQLPVFVEMVREQQPDSPIPDVLEAAYDMAVNAIPAVREKVKAAEAQATATEIKPERAEAAKKAASINVKSTSNGKVRSLSEEEEMAAAYDRAMAN